MPYKWAKQFGIKIGTNINDVNLEFFTKQLNSFSDEQLAEFYTSVTPDTSFKEELEAIKIDGNRELIVNYLADLKYKSFQKSLLAVVGRIK
jgi:hypothetical protein